MFSAIQAILRSRPRPTVFELGGHDGEDTLRMLEFAPDADYHLFEPDPRNVAVLRKRGLAERVRVVEAAIGSADRLTDLHLSSGSPDPESNVDWTCSSSIKRPLLHLAHHPWCRFESTVTVRVRSLDSYCREVHVGRIDFIWADIQGAEAEMISGGTEALRRTRYLKTEYSDYELYEAQPSLREILQLLPGRWRILLRDATDVLLCNESFEDEDDDDDGHEASATDTTTDGSRDDGYGSRPCIKQERAVVTLPGRRRPDVRHRWQFRILMPTSNAYAETVLPITLSLLDRYWPDHPAVDIMHFERRPPPMRRCRWIFAGVQMSVTWTAAVRDYLETANNDQLILLMLDDYGVCAPVARPSLYAAQAAMLDDGKIANVHLTWMPVAPKVDFGLLKVLPRWPYSINTQAALWQRHVLLDVAMHNPACQIEDFETVGSSWFNSCRFDQFAHCQIAMPEPPNPSAFTDETDKTYWAIPYNNLVRRGVRDDRHVDFLTQHGFSFNAGEEALSSEMENTGDPSLPTHIDSRGFWLRADREWHYFDQGLADELAAFFHGFSVVDLGCGPGDYVRFFEGRGIACAGFDGNPNTPQLTCGRCEILDLSERIELQDRSDWVLSLEVGEHIPCQFEATYIDNLHRHNRRGIVVSWAVPGQGGNGHCNERSNEYVKSRFEALGYYSDDAWERRFREASVASWFKKTVLVFRRS